MGKAYKSIFNDADKSVRRSTTDGATLPHLITISHTDAVDSKTKVSCRRSTMRVDLTHVDTGGVNPSPLPVSCYVVLVKGKGVYAPSTTAIQLAINSLVQLLAQTAADASALALRDPFGVNEEQ